MITDINLFYEPRKILFDLSMNGRGAEMSERQSAFLCGLLKKYKPKKILEVGVAAGGTTAIVLNCISMLGLETNLISVDVSENYYQDIAKKTGFLAEECERVLDCKGKHVLYTGKYLPELLETIGGGIDFLILDTVHCLPGELLDFLAVYPLLNREAIVVLHDIILNHCKGGNKDCFATNLLLGAVVADKYFDIDNNGFLSNIGAFMVTADTGRYIENIFQSLLMTWNYCPDDQSLHLYRECYKQYYSPVELQLFDIAVRLNKETVCRYTATKQFDFIKMYNWIATMKQKMVYIYGCGNYGRKLGHVLSLCGINLGGYIVSDGQKINDGTTFYISDIVLKKEEEIVLIGVNPSLFPEICTVLQEHEINDYILPIDEMLEYIKMIQ